MLSEYYSPAHCVGQTVDAGRLLLVKILGEGAYGVVYLAVEQETIATSSPPTSPPKQYAVKVLRRAADWTMEGQAQSREIVAHKIANGHPNVLKLHDVLEDEEFIYLVLDYCPGGDLYSAIVEQHAFTRNDALLRSVFLQILDAVQTCHDQGIYHRDLKPDNIFVSECGTQVYLGDFGLATDQAVSTNFGCGSSFYMSPECIGDDHAFTPYSTETSDIWSLGVILTNMITGRNPWRLASTEDHHFHQFVSNNEAIFELLAVSKPAGDLLKRIFTFIPSHRITLAELRAEILAIDTFFPSDGELATAKPTVKCAAAAYTPRAPTPATPEFAHNGSIHSLQGYPDDEYLFASPDPDAPLWDPTVSTAASTPSSDYSDSSTLFDEVSLDYQGKEKEMEAVQEDDIAATKLANQPAVGAAMRFLARVLA